MFGGASLACLSLCPGELRSWPRASGGEHGQRAVAAVAGRAPNPVACGSLPTSPVPTQVPTPALCLLFQFKRLQGKRNRGREEVNFVDIKGDDQLGGAQQWVTKSLTEEKTMKSFSKVSGKVGGRLGGPHHTWPCSHWCRRRPAPRYRPCLRCVQTAAVSHL